MKNVLEFFLDAIEVRYNKHFADRLYFEHPHRYNMYGIKRMLDVYGVKTIGVHTEDKDLSVLNYPCILHTYGDFTIGINCDTDKITYLQNGRTTIASHDVFKQTWTGNALVIEETTEAKEPDYKSNLRKGIVDKAKICSIPFMLILSLIIGMVTHFQEMTPFFIMGLFLNTIGVFVCFMLLQKQLMGESRYGDRGCSLFSHAGCNSILYGPKSKILGISWSEVGMGYFTANVLLITLFPEMAKMAAIINWIAMSYGIWSIYYQWQKKIWCVLCVISQIVIWLTGIVAIISCISAPFTLEVGHSLLSCILYGICIMSVHHYAKVYKTEKERILSIQKYRALKANSKVAGVLIENEKYFETSPKDSSILFGNTEAKIRVTILSNPHCNPCAQMHKRVEKLLRLSGDEICVQYIFSSFSENLEDSSRYLIYCYFENGQDKALRKFADWYLKDKFNYEKIIHNNDAYIHTDKIEGEMEKHREWRIRTSLTETPTILVNGYKLPNEYEIEDLAMIANSIIAEKNIVQDINDRSTTPYKGEK